MILKFLPLHGSDDGEGVGLDVVVEHHLHGQRKLKVKRGKAGDQVVQQDPADLAHIT